MSSAKATRATTGREYTITVASGADEFPSGQWDELARRGFHRHRWFRVTEASGHRSRHLVVEKAGTPAAVFPLYTRRAELYGDLHHRWLGPARDVLDSLDLTVRPTTVCAPPLATVSEPLGAGDDLPPEVLGRVLAAVEEIAWDAGSAAVVWPFLTQASEDLLERARERGYVTAFEGSRAVLDVEWDSMDGYVASRGRSSGRTIRRELESIEASDVVVEALGTFGEVAGEMDRRYRAFYREHNGRGAPMPPDFFARLAEDPGDGVWAQVARRGGELLAASVMLEAGGTVDGTLAVYADEVLGGPLYHHDLVYAPLRRAFGTGIERIDLGPGSLYPKVLRGAELEPRTTAVLGRTAVHRTALATLARAVSARNRQKEERAVGELLP